MSSVEHRSPAPAGARSQLGSLADTVASRVVAAAPTLIWVAVGAGAVLRIARYVENRSLWLDESLLSLNVTTKSWHGLLGQLDYLQSAPAGFLLVERAAFRIVGDGEYSLRLFPLLASLAALVLFVLVARRLLSPIATLLATALFATNGFLLYQSSELKPYGSDAAVALLLAWLALRAADEGPLLATLGPLAVVAPVAVWFSFPSVMVLGAVYVALALPALERRDRRRVAVLTGLAASWLVSFGVLYAVSSTNVSQISNALFTGETTHGGSRVSGVVHNVWSTFVNPGAFQSGTNGLAVLVFCIGVLALIRRRALGTLALLLVPLLLAAAAAFLGKYPLGGRFSLFLAPFVVLLVALGAQTVLENTRLPVVGGVLLAIFLAASPAATALARLAHLDPSENVKPLLRDAARGWQPGDQLYVYRNAQYALRYYTLCHDCDPNGKDFPWPYRLAGKPPAGDEFAPALLSIPGRVVVGPQHVTEAETLASLNALRPGRVWVLFTHPSKTQGIDDEAAITAALDARGHRLARYGKPQASLYLYELPAG